jgi:hypothetical protein
MKIRSERDSELEKSKPTGKSGTAATRGKPSREPVRFGDGEAKNEDKQR